MTIYISQGTSTTTIQKKTTIEKLKENGQQRGKRLTTNKSDITINTYA